MINWEVKTLREIREEDYIIDNWFKFIEDEDN